MAIGAILNAASRGGPKTIGPAAVVLPQICFEYDHSQCLGSYVAGRFPCRSTETALVNEIQ
jgi:hypothetical protein